MSRLKGAAVFAVVWLIVWAGGAEAAAGATERPQLACSSIDGKRTVCADVSAIDQTLVYNRFGSFNPFGMIFSLTRDLSNASVVPEAIDADQCAKRTGAEPGVGALEAGKVRLKDCKRPRPLVLRARAGDILKVTLRNMLRPDAPGFSETFCRQDGAAILPNGTRLPDGTLLPDGSTKDRVADTTFFGKIRKWVSEGPEDVVKHHEAACETGSRLEAPRPDPTDAEWPRERRLNFSIQGLTAVNKDGKQTPAPPPECLGLAAIEPGGSIDCHYAIDREGPYFIASTAAPSGGEGDGGSITHGLFGAVVVEREDTTWYRSQVSGAAFEKAWAFDAAKNVPHARKNIADIARYEVIDETNDNVPILNILKNRGADAFEIVHSDLNAIIHREGVPGSTDQKTEPVSFREFSVFFHDELRSFTTRNFEELDSYDQLAGVRDGFAINYGASGMGTLLLANRKGIGPAAKCAECLYEEFFLASWANGDPALLESFPDDPSNVHHSYLNDAIVFRNFHAGPKETHVFHLHAHQWFSGNDRGRGSYLDSQTVAPQQGFTYDIYDGGLKRPRPGLGDDAWDASKGSGNRNRTLGDSIFHCHLYPHFAQGMWELWRVHDVLEDGTRVLPDGQLEPGFSLAEVDDATKAKRRPGSVDPITGKLYRHAAGDGERRKLGSPIPALVPLPGQAWPLLPSYPAKPDGAPDVVPVDPANPPNRGSISLDPANPSFATATANTMPGYPFYIAGRPGHRPPQAPLDLALATKDEGQVKKNEPLDGGLPRHVVTDDSKRIFGVEAPDFAPLAEQRKRENQQAQYVAKVLAMGDMTAHLEKARLDLLPHGGTPLEQAAMRFHGEGADLQLRKADGAVAAQEALGAYPSLATTGVKAFHVNGSPAAPGAPFADPCGVAKKSVADAQLTTDPFLLGALAGHKINADPKLIGFRRYEGSAVQLDLVTNRAGWHDPQARINVLTALSDRYKDDAPADGQRKPAAYSPRVSASEEPFFFRALSGECIEFRHTNELPKDLELDDFQVKTPTDTIGQHIHLVKFDVTSSDGSGNGFNYEDGTFAADEVAARICAARTAGMPTDQPYDPNKPGIIERGLCEAKAGETVFHPKETDIWRKSRSKFPHRFQTTTQRWFADPILSDVRASGDPVMKEVSPGSGNWVEDPDKKLPTDRTLRTVFTHDHFGPSSIQQHGFYSALIIEPAKAKVCDVENVFGPDGSVQPPACAADDPADNPRRGTAEWVGAKKVLEDPDYLDPEGRNFREFALAIADFATLYDPRDSETKTELLARLDKPFAPGEPDARDSEGPKGLAALYCELKHADDPQALKQRCGSALQQDQDNAWFAGAENTPPAWVAAKMPGDKPEHSADLLAGQIDDQDRNDVRDHLIRYRRMAAGHKADDPNGRLAKPVNPPQRPESISVDHHDPYLLNYRGEPLPLRVGRGEGNENCALQPLAHWVAALANGVNERCTVKRQKAFPNGDMANVFLSSLHGDPATPVMETYTSDRVLFRLIQGAQEVQHTFTLEGYNWPRNIDQRFSTVARALNDTTPEPKSLSRKCEERKTAAGLVVSSSGRPDQYGKWLRKGPDAFSNPTDKAYWKGYEGYLADCLNVEGRVAAQEVGISEHFEFSGAYRNDLNAFELRKLDPEAAKAEVDPGVDQARKSLISTDVLQHFGSLDALWNGAWSLLRVYKDEYAVDAMQIDRCAHFSQSFDNTSTIWDCLEKLSNVSAADGSRAASYANRIGRRLPGLPERAAMELRAREAPATPVAVECREGAPIIHAALVAIEARRVFGSAVDGLSDEGTPYARRLYDRNGLFMALVDPRAVAQSLPAGKTWTSWLSEKAAWIDIDKSAVIQAIEAAYARPEPFALHVRAGDCVRLTVINALEHSGSDPDRPGLKDDLGDAPMPKITPLNVEPDWSTGVPVDPAVEAENSPLLFEQQNRVNIRPSARLALNLPLPVLNHQQDVSRPFGWNRTGALAGTEKAATTLTIEDTAAWGLRTANIEQLSFYAGRAGVPTDFTTDAGNTAPVHWIPYAFGALPVKSAGDIVGHGAHGLFGAVVVHPKSAANLKGEAGALTLERLQDHAPPAGKVCDEATGENCAYVATPGPKPFRPWIAAYDIQDSDAGKHNVRSFTLFWQDGLNLRDRDSHDEWDALDLPDPKLVSDCKICDDSYDWGEAGVNYRSAPFHIRLRKEPNGGGGPSAERHYNLNAYKFGSAFFTLRDDEIGQNGRPEMLVARAAEGEEVVLDAVHPGGRARQRSLIAIGHDYNDLFPSFGFPHSALLAPGKAVTAAFTRPVVEGCTPWFDGPAQLRAGGTWGLLDVVAKDKLGDLATTSCKRP